MKITGAEVGDSIFLSCGKEKDLEKIIGLARDKIGKDLDLIDQDVFAFCWIVDYPMFERDEVTNKIEFSHNPFSMPQGNTDEINFEKPLDILAYQYDIVCNGIELSSGAIRNHKPELMYKLFSIAGYDKSQDSPKLTEFSVINFVISDAMGCFAISILCHGSKAKGSAALGLIATAIVWVMECISDALATS